MAQQLCNAMAMSSGPGAASSEVRNITAYYNSNMYHWIVVLVPYSHCGNGTLQYHVAHTNTIWLPAESENISN